MIIGMIKAYPIQIGCEASYPRLPAPLVTYHPPHWWTLGGTIELKELDSGGSLALPSAPWRNFVVRPIAPARPLRRRSSTAADRPDASCASSAADAGPGAARNQGSVGHQAGLVEVGPQAVELTVVQAVGDAG